MQKIRFSSDDLPSTLDDQAKLDAWLKFYSNFYTSIDMQRTEGRPFVISFEAVQIGRFRIARVVGSLKRLARTQTQTEHSRNNDFLVCINVTSSLCTHFQGGREVVLEPGSAVLSTNAEPGVVQAESELGWIFVALSDVALDELHPGATDLIGRPFDVRNPGLRQLERYANMLLATDDIADEPALTAHIDATLHDLVTLAFHFEDEMAPIARMGAVRGAQFRDVVKEIKGSFQEPDFSADDVCRKLSLSPRYLQALLTESGASFTERVIELRLQHARALLDRTGNRQAKISDIAYQAGFSDVSYFNRCFRQRFAMSPSEFRSQRFGAR